jgi:hypothetical protein
VPDWIGNFQNPISLSILLSMLLNSQNGFLICNLYTPVNEIFITAMFSAQYGWWNERLHSDKAFVTALKILPKPM